MFPADAVACPLIISNQIFCALGHKNIGILDDAAYETGSAHIHIIGGKVVIKVFSIHIIAQNADDACRAIEAGHAMA